MKRCVLLCRCSTDKEKGLQDYQYQIDTLTEICKKRDWEIVKVFGGYVSGAAPIEERQEILDLIAYVKESKIDFCCATEISRVSRDLITGVQIIRTLADNGVNLYLANYNLSTLDDNGKISPVTSLILTITLEISQLERQQIRTRMQMGYSAYLQRRKEDKSLKLGRPSTYRKSEQEYREQYSKELSLLRKGISLRNVQQLTGTAIGTLRKLKHFL
jgi:DNA invertase Pin-like site-specific DNA recombinase